MPAQSPTVTVWIPSYNHAIYLPEAIESVLSQSFDDFELLIVDDGSSDDSLAIARGFAARHPNKIRVATHPGEVNRGVSATVNLANSLANGRYWTGLPSDDVLPIDSLKLRVAFLEDHQDCAFVYGRAFTFEHTNPTTGYEWGTDITSLSEPCEFLLKGNVIPGMTVMARRECWQGTGRHDETLDYSDWQFWFRMFAQYRGGFIRQVLALQRKHGRNYSMGNEHRRYRRYTRDFYVSLDNILEETAPHLSDARSRAEIAMMIARSSFCVGDLAEAAHYFSRAMRDDGGIILDQLFMKGWIEAGILAWSSGDPGSPIDFTKWLISPTQETILPANYERDMRLLIQNSSSRLLSVLVDNEFRKEAKEIIVSELLAHPTKVFRDRLFAEGVVKYILRRRGVRAFRWVKSLLKF